MPCLPSNVPYTGIAIAMARLMTVTRVLVSVSEMAETKEMVARPVVDGETISAWGQRMEITVGLGVSECAVLG